MRIRKLRQDAVKNADKFQALSSNGFSGGSSGVGSYGAGGYDSGNCGNPRATAGKYGGYEGDSNFDNTEHPTVDYSDTATSGDFNDSATTGSKSRGGKKKKQSAVTSSADHDAAVDAAFEASFDDEFERDLQQATSASLAESRAPKPSQSPTATHDDGNYSDHEGRQSTARQGRQEEASEEGSSQQSSCFVYRQWVSTSTRQQWGNIVVGGSVWLTRYQCNFIFVLVSSSRKHEQAIS